MIYDELSKLDRLTKGYWDQNSVLARLSYRNKEFLIGSRATDGFQAPISLEMTSTTVYEE